MSPNSPQFKDAFQPQARAFSCLVSLFAQVAVPLHPHSSFGPHSSHLSKIHQSALPHPLQSCLPGWINSLHMLQGHSSVSQGHSVNCVFSPHGVRLSDLIFLEGGPGYIFLASQLPSFFNLKKVTHKHEPGHVDYTRRSHREHKTERASLPHLLPSSPWASSPQLKAVLSLGFESCLSSLYL